MKIKNLDIPCLGARCGTPTDGYDYDCEYEQSGDIICEECVCNYGQYNPKTGKRISWLLRIIQTRRAIKHYKILQTRRAIKHYKIPQTLYVRMPDNKTIKPVHVIHIEQTYTEAESPDRYLDIYTRYVDRQTNGLVVFHPCDIGTILFESEHEANLSLCLNQMAEDLDYKNSWTETDFLGHCE